VNDPLIWRGTRSRTPPRGVVHAPPCQAPQAAEGTAVLPHEEGPPMLPMETVPVQYELSVRLASAW
jgi:hypothetical protein